MKKIIVTGGTGFIGKPLVAELVRRGHHVVLLTRNPVKVPNTIPDGSPGKISTYLWDGKTGDGARHTAWMTEIEGADAVINLAGESIGTRRWTAGQKRKIEESRVEATRAIVETIGRARKRPTVLINGSAIGYYGDTHDEPVTEQHRPSSDFLGSVCQRWEAEASRVEGLGVRLVMLRTGIVLEQGGGALQKMALPFKFFGGGPLGTGRQWMPWIHRNDVIRIIVFALEHDQIHGPINVCAPNPVTMKEFASALGRAMGTPSWAPVPSAALRLLLGEMSVLVLGGQRAVPEKVLGCGFEFQYTNVETALAAIFPRR